MTFRFALVSCLFLATAAVSVSAQNEDAPPNVDVGIAGKSIDELTADEVLKLVRYSYTLYNRDFTGQLRMSLTEKVPFLLSLNPESIRFIFDDPAQVIYVDTRDHEFALFEGVGGAEMEPVNPSKFGQEIRGTDVTYDDLSMRFLYWPNARIVGEEKVKTRDTWQVRVRNPDGAGAYATVDAWIDKISGGMIKMMGYDRNGRPIRRFQVLHGKKFGDVWMVDEMRIETIDRATGQIESRTRMQIKEEVN